jgi:aspartate-semialdehyde dehydrogenase
MVGSVLMQRMLEEKDFDLIEPVFLSTSSAGGKGPAIGKPTAPLGDAGDAKAFAGLDAIVTCQGGEWTKPMYAKLRAGGWNGYFIDAASTLRMADDAVIILDPVNRHVIDAALARGVKNYIGGNCTVSLDGDGGRRSVPARLDEWMTCMTYQSASGAGANIASSWQQMGEAHPRPRSCSTILPHRFSTSTVEVAGILRDERFPTEHPGAARRQPGFPGRRGHGRRGEPGGVEGAAPDQQDPRPRQEPHPGRIDLRAHRRDARRSQGLTIAAAQPAACRHRKDRGRS